jgi:SAM-dependent methyltransferase
MRRYESRRGAGEPPTAFAVEPEGESGESPPGGNAVTPPSLTIVPAPAAVHGPDDRAHAAEKKLLHVGCGPANPGKLPVLFRGSDWREVRLDIDAACKPDIVASMTSMSDVETGSYDAVFSSHNLEHLYPHEVSLALKEFHRVLASDGFALIALPGLQSVAELVAQDKLESSKIPPMSRP